MEYHCELNQELIDKFNQILESIDLINQRVGDIENVDDLLSSSWGVTTLDSCLMRIQVMGELINAIDHKTDGSLFGNFPKVPWKNIISLRNIISHEYSNIDYDIIWDVIKNHLKPLKEEIWIIVEYLSKK